MLGKTLFVFLMIIAFNAVFIFVFDSWSFHGAIFYNIFWATHFSLIVCSVSIMLIRILGNIRLFLLLASVISLVIFVMQFNPIDTYEYPKDVEILSETDYGKIVVRAKRNGKTNEIEKDTVKVIDKFIFRKVISLHQN